MLAYLRSLLRSPSSYTAQPWAYARNQIGHGVAFGALWVSIFGWPAIPVVPPIYAITVEFWQWRNCDAEAWDCLEDTAHVLGWAMAAACVPINLWLALGVFAVVLLWLASGILRRRMEASDAFGA